jgi:hypothetical protein
MNVYVDFRQYVVDTLTGLQTAVAEGFNRLESQIMASKEEVLGRLDSATNEVAADLTDLRDRLQQAIVDKDQAVQDAVNAVLGDFDAPISRLEAIGQDPANPVPDPEPTPEPTPGDGTDVTNPTTQPDGPQP